jgi:hypothetical protein
MLRATFSSIKPVGKSHCNFELSEKNSQCNMYLMSHVAGRGRATRRYALPLPCGLGGHRGSPPPPFSSAGSGSMRLRGEAMARRSWRRIGAARALEAGGVEKGSAADFSNRMEGLFGWWIGSLALPYFYYFL